MIFGDFLSIYHVLAILGLFFGLPIRFWGILRGSQVGILAQNLALRLGRPREYAGVPCEDLITSVEVSIEREAFGNSGVQATHESNLRRATEEIDGMKIYLQ